MLAVTPAATPWATPALDLLMTTDAVGGVWRYALDACQALAAGGIEASLVGLGPLPSAAQRDEAEAAGVSLHWLDCPLDWAAGGRDALARSGETLDRFVRLRAPDLVHLNGPALLPYLDPGRPRLAAAHSCLATWWSAVKEGAPPAEWGWHRQAMADGLRAADTVVAPSKAFAAALQQAYGPLPNLVAVPNAAQPIPPEPKEPVVLAAGRWWDEGKNLAVLDAAASDILWPVLVAGPLSAEGAAEAAPEAAFWIGDLPYAAMRRWLARTAIFVSPSLYEPFGLAVLEAAGSGAGLVLADIPTFRELWDGCALFADPRAPQAFAAAVNRLARDEDLRRRLASAARRRAERYTVEAQAAALTAIYAQCRPGLRRAV